MFCALVAGNPQNKKELCVKWWRWRWWWVQLIFFQFYSNLKLFWHTHMHAHAISSTCTCSQCQFYFSQVARDLKGYHYGESTQIVAEYPDDAYQYDIILRSDLDAFLTPGWAAWVPERRHTMWVCTQYSTERLRLGTIDSHTHSDPCKRVHVHRISLYKRCIVSTLTTNNSLHHVAFFCYFFHTSTIIIITSFHNYTISGASFFIVVLMLHVHHHVRYPNPSHAGTLAKEGSSKATRSTGSRPSSGCGMQRRG